MAPPHTSTPGAREARRGAGGAAPRARTCFTCSETGTLKRDATRPVRLLFAVGGCVHGLCLNETDKNQTDQQFNSICSPSKRGERAPGCTSGTGEADYSPTEVGDAPGVFPPPPLNLPRYDFSSACLPKKHLPLIAIKPTTISPALKLESLVQDDLR